MIRLVHHEGSVTVRLLGFAGSLRRVVGRYRVGRDASDLCRRRVHGVSSGDLHFCGMENKSVSIVQQLVLLVADQVIV